MHNPKSFFHNFSGQACGSWWGQYGTYSQPAVKTGLIHGLFTINSHDFPHTMWMKNSVFTSVKLAFPQFPQALLLLITTFKNLRVIVKMLFRRIISTIIGWQEGVSK